jgi:hypothetical protein
VCCVAFLRFAHDTLRHFAPQIAYRILDGDTGLLLANSSVVTRVRATVEAHPDDRGEPRSGCGASLAEFSGLSEEEAATVGLKLSPTWPYRLPIGPHALVLGCAGDSLGANSIDVGWFAPCALPDERYALDYINEDWHLRARPRDMKALLDSLVASGSTFAARADPTDTLSLMLRRVVLGRERVFECTLGGDTFRRVVRVLSHVFVGARPVFGASPPEAILRTNLWMWTTQIDREASAIWRASELSGQPAK